MQNIESVYHNLLQPSEALLADMDSLDGDIIILGAGGKMGPDLARLAQHAIEKTGSRKKIIAVARFSEPGLKDELTQLGIETIKADRSTTSSSGNYESKTCSTSQEISLVPQK